MMMMTSATTAEVAAVGTRMTKIDPAGDGAWPTMRMFRLPEEIVRMWTKEIVGLVRVVEREEGKQDTADCAHRRNCGDAFVLWGGAAVYYFDPFGIFGGTSSEMLAWRPLTHKWSH